VPVDPLEVINKYYGPGSKAHYFLVHHSRLVSRKAVEIGRRVGHLAPDLTFIEEAALLHDIGIFYTDAPRLGCFGHKDYLCHGYLGRELLEKEGLPHHALVCERHVGMGITLEEIRNNELPLPPRDMVPLSVEEKIVCLADKFFSKSNHDLLHEKPLENVREMIAAYGRDKLEIFDDWLKLFKLL
jgi:uncharacterized protein